MFLGLELGKYFGTWGVSLVKVSLGALRDLMIGKGEGYLIGLSLGLPIGTLFVIYPGNSLGSLLGYVWHVNWCGTWFGACKLF